MLAAYDLRCRGYRVTLFEADEAPGGMLRWAIPEFRLPTALLESEFSLLTDMGAEIRCNTAVGKEISMTDIKAEFHAVIIATGCPAHARLNTKGEDLSGVYHGLPFLREVRAGDAPPVGKRVVVIGGGNVAVDAAQTALRLGADDVTMVCLESDQEVPAHPQALTGAIAEGVKLECSWGPARFVGSGDAVEEVEFQRCVSVFDDCGCFEPVFDSCELKVLDAETVIVAIGQTRDHAMLDRIEMAVDRLDRIDPLTLQVGEDKIFAAGDLVSGPSSVIGAMARGRQAAESVHRFLQGEHLTYGRAYPGPVETHFDIDTRRGSSDSRAKIPSKPFSGQGDFGEIETSFDTDTARREALRCHSCGQPFGKYRTCWFCLPCEVECPHEAMNVEIPYLLR